MRLELLSAACGLAAIVATSIEAAAPVPAESLPATAPRVAAPAPATWVVVLADHRQVVARSRPILAFGQVSWVDETGASRTLPASAVDVEATRSRLGASAVPRTWNAETLARHDMSHVVLNVTGDGVVAPAPPPLPGAAAPTPLNTTTSGLAQQGSKLKAELAQLDKEAANLKSTDPTLSIIRTRQTQLREQLGQLDTIASAKP